MKHQESGKNTTRLYTIWKSMRRRCLGVTHSSYRHYGGRGISICDEWEDFLKFREWALTNGYKDLLTLDRKNNDGNYEPDNCRWVTQRTNSNNRRNTVTVTAFGETKPLAFWAEDDRCKVSYRVLHKRLFISGWPVEKAITKELWR